MKVYLMSTLSLFESCFRLVLGCMDSINFIPVSVMKFLQLKYPRCGVAIEMNVCRHRVTSSGRCAKHERKIIPPIECPTIITLIFLLVFSVAWARYIYIYLAAFLPISSRPWSMCCEYDLSTKNLLLGNSFFNDIFSFSMFPLEAWYPCASRNTFRNYPLLFLFFFSILISTLSLVSVPSSQSSSSSSSR